MRMYKTWLIEVASKISCKECEAAEIPCPHCHEKSIDYIVPRYHKLTPDK